MKKYNIPAAILIAYSALLIQLLIFKTVSFRIGHLVFNFTGHATGPANFLPFKTILPYLLGEKGLVIAVFNIVGNILLFVPFGFIFPFVFKNMTWQKSLVLSVSIPLLIEIAQVLLRVGIFDIDDVILNGMGIMIGYGIFSIFKRIRKDAVELKP